MLTISVDCSILDIATPELFIPLLIESNMFSFFPVSFLSSVDFPQITFTRSSNVPVTSGYFLFKFAVSWVRLLSTASFQQYFSSL